MFTQFLTWLKGVGTSLLGKAEAAAAQIPQEVVTEFDSLVTQYTPLAIQLAQQAESAFTVSSDKRGSVITGLETQLQIDGKSLESDGISALVNLLVEIGANFINMLTGTQAK